MCLPASGHIAGKKWNIAHFAWHSSHVTALSLLKGWHIAKKKKKTPNTLLLKQNPLCQIRCCVNRPGETDWETQYIDLFVTQKDKRGAPGKEPEWYSGVINHIAPAFTLTNRVPEWGLKYGETCSPRSVINTLFGWVFFLLHSAVKWALVMRVIDSSAWN